MQTIHFDPPSPVPTALQGGGNVVPSSCGGVAHDNKESGTNVFEKTGTIKWNWKVLAWKIERAVAALLWMRHFISRQRSNTYSWSAFELDVNHTFAKLVMYSQYVCNVLNKTACCCSVCDDVFRDSTRLHRCRQQLMASANDRQQRRHFPAVDEASVFPPVLQTVSYNDVAQTHWTRRFLSRVRNTN